MGRLIAVGVVGCAGLVVAFGAPAASSLSVPVAPLPGGQIAYTWSTHTSVTQPDGTSTYQTSPKGVAVVNVNGSGEAELTPGSLYGDVVTGWSPDGKYVLFDQPADGGGGQICVVAAAGGPVVVLGSGVNPRWSPDGSHIAWETANNFTAQLMIAPIAGSPPHIDTASAVHVPVTNLAGIYWSPDGSTLAFLQDRDQQWPDHDDLWVVNADGSSPRQLTSGLNIINWPQVAWSPLGTQIAFMVDVDQGTYSLNGHVFVINSDGSGLHQLRTDTPYDYGFAWHPSGLGLAMPSAGENGIDIVALTGQVVATITPPTDQEIQDVEWTADGTHLLYLGVPRANSATSPYNDLFSIGIDGGDHHTLVSDNAPSGDFVLYSTGTAIRTFGQSAIGTGIALARQLFGSASAAVLARADQYADGLAGGALAGKIGAPLMLNPSDHLDAGVAAELKTLGATTVYLLGGTTALSPEVEDGLRADGITDIRRVAGPDRFATAQAIAALLSSTNAFIAEGQDPDPSRGWPDAIAVSGLAAHTGQPILLTEPAALPAATVQALQQDHISAVTIIGGTAVVSDSVAQQLAAMGIQVTRIGGADRYATSVAIAQLAAQQGMTPSTSVLVDGTSWPDGLMAGPAAAHTNSDLLLVNGSNDSASPASQQWLTDYAGTFSQIDLVGDPSTITAPVATDINRLAD